jgi:hypothetical protein
MLRRSLLKEIPLTQGKFAMVDDTDYEAVSRFKWHAHFDDHNWYAIRRTKTGHQKMHIFLMQPPAGVEIDHKDRNGLNNQRGNLRICLHHQNMSNTFRPTLNRSGFKGVSWKKRNRKWCAQIAVKRVVKHIGLFDSKEDAARAYDTQAELLHGEFALTNQKLGLL